MQSGDKPAVAHFVPSPNLKIRIYVIETINNQMIGKETHAMFGLGVLLLYLWQAWSWKHSERHQHLFTISQLLVNGVQLSF